MAGWCALYCASVCHGACGHRRHRRHREPPTFPPHAPSRLAARPLVRRSVGGLLAGVPFLHHFLRDALRSFPAALFSPSHTLPWWCTLMGGSLSSSCAIEKCRSALLCRLTYIRQILSVTCCSTTSFPNNCIRRRRHYTLINTVPIFLESTSL
jgi:hypothetical protein